MTRRLATGFVITALIAGTAALNGTEALAGEKLYRSAPGKDGYSAYYGTTRHFGYSRQHGYSLDYPLDRKSGYGNPSPFRRADKPLFPKGPSYDDVPITPGSNTGDTGDLPSIEVQNLEPLPEGKSPRDAEAE